MTLPMTFGDTSGQCVLPTQIVVFRWLETCRPGCYLVHLQGNMMGPLLTASGVFESADVLRHAVVDDFGDLVRVTS